LRDKEEVFHHCKIPKGGGEDLVIKISIAQDVDSWEEILCPC